MQATTSVSITSQKNVPMPHRLPAEKQIISKFPAVSLHGPLAYQDTVISYLSSMLIKCTQTSDKYRVETPWAKDNYVLADSVDNAANKVNLLGRGSLIAKIDIKSAYQLVPVWPLHSYWLGIDIQDRVAIYFS